MGTQQPYDALNKKQAWIDQILGAIQEGIVTLDDRGHVTFFSRRAELLTGRHGAEVLGRHCDDVFPVAENEPPFSQLLPLPGDGRKFTVDTGDGRTVTLHVQRIQLRLSDEETTETVLILRDMNEAGTIDHLLSHFLADITHEFRTPLAALAASIELLRDKASDLTQGEQQELLTSLHLGILGLQTLVDNLLEATNLQSGQFQVSPQPAQLGTIIRDAVLLMRPLVEKYRQRLTVEIPADLPSVRVDPQRIGQVLVNLLSNATKYGPEGNEIAIEAKVVPGWVRITVADRGPGIPPQSLENLFGRFVHFDSGPGQDQHGMGLGLWIVDAVVGAHGGKVGVDPRPGGGSIFWFTLPLIEGT